MEFKETEVIESGSRVAELQETIVVSATTPAVFQRGIFPVTCLKLETSHSNIIPDDSPPKPLLIVTPTIEGIYPVILFLHGFCLRNTFYSDLLQHISSHGYVVVAPQLYLLCQPLCPPTGQEEVDRAAEVANWLPKGLQAKLQPNVRANLSQLALAGHSRGGKAAFALALGKSRTEVTINFSAIIGIDPVAGPNKCMQIQPKILTYQPRSFKLSIPATVIGTGLGDEWKHCIMMPCAAPGVNHEEFFNECRPPCGHFVASEYGLMDMLNDDLPGLDGGMADCMCKNGKSPRDPMRRCVGGIVVASLKAFFRGEKEDLLTIVGDPTVAPVKLDPPKFIEP